MIKAINNKKKAGIMTEIVEHKNIQYIIIGAGINILTSPADRDKVYDAISKQFNSYSREQLKRELDREKKLKRKLGLWA